MTLTIFETPHVSVREWSLQDVDSYFKLAANPLVMRYISEPIKDPLQALEAIKRRHRDYATRGYGRYAVVEKSSGKVIGLTGLRYDSDIDCVDVAIWLLPDYWGNGLGTEILIECFSFCFDRLALKRVVGIVDPLNGASKRILEKCGMIFLGIIDYHGEKCELYSIFKI
ncbi:MAG: GNAT family N-acetyltransferase [Rhizonema sp. PD38]|nr:GNAT family N-acetyltransferase [Rhizonema sp. PD38]